MAASRNRWGGGGFKGAAFEGLEGQALRDLRAEASRETF